MVKKPSVACEKCGGGMDPRWVAINQRYSHPYHDQESAQGGTEIPPPAPSADVPPSQPPAPATPPPPDGADRAPRSRPDPVDAESGPPSTPTHRHTPRRRPTDQQPLTARQREILRVAKGEVEKGGTLQGAATTLGIKPDAVAKALERVGAHALRTKLTGGQTGTRNTAGAGTAVTPTRTDGHGRVAYGSVSGGREKREETPEGQRAWQEARRAAAARRVQAMPPRNMPLSTGALQFALDSTGGRVLAPDEVDELARREAAAAGLERRALMARKEGTQ